LGPPFCGDKNQSSWFKRRTTGIYTGELRGVEGDVRSIKRRWDSVFCFESPTPFEGFEGKHMILRRLPGEVLK